MRGLAIEQADADDRHPEHARGLQQLARDRAEPSGEDRQAVGQRELRREVRDLYRLRLVRQHEPRLGTPPVPVEVVGHIDQQAQEVGIIEDRLEARRVEERDETHRIATGGLPSSGIQLPEQRERLVVPGPAQVACKTFEATADVVRREAGPTPRPGRGGRSLRSIRLNADCRTSYWFYRCR